MGSSFMTFSKLWSAAILVLINNALLMSLLFTGAETLQQADNKFALSEFYNTEEVLGGNLTTKIVGTGGTSTSSGLPPILPRCLLPRRWKKFTHGWKCVKCPRHKQWVRIHQEWVCRQPSHVQDKNWEIRGIGSKVEGHTFKTSKINMSE